MEPSGGNAKFTLFIGGHIDSSWHTPVLARHPERSRFKIISGVGGGAIMLLFSLLRILNNYAIIDIPIMWSNFVPIIFIPGWYWIARYLVWTKEKASPGSMDDLAGIAVSMWRIKYYNENPDQRPKDCRIVLLAVGAEEAGLKGSFDFVKKHKQDLLAEENDPWVLIIDGVGDADFIEVVCGDDWLSTKYDKNFVNLAEKAMKDINVKYNMITNPVGGTDAAAFTRGGVKSLVLAAQDPTPRNNYHTCFDKLDRIEPDATIGITKASIRLIDLIDEYVHSK